MNGYLRQSTAGQSRLLGPFIDDVDFKSAETGLTIANTDIKLRANGTTLANKNSGGGTHQVSGMYSVTWDATDTANVGELGYSVVVAGALQVFGWYTVLEEAVYDALFEAAAGGYASQASVTTIDDFLDTEIADIQARLPAALTAGGHIKADALALGGTGQTGRDIGASVLLSSGTGTGQLDFTTGVVKANLAQILATALTETAGLLAGGFKKFFNVAMPTGTLNSIPDAVPDAVGGLPITGTRLTAIPTVANVTTVGSVTGAVGSVTAGVTLAASAVQAVWDALTSALITAGSIGKRIVDFLTGDAFARLGAPIGASVSADLQTRLASADITLTSGKVTPIDVDGLTHAKAMEVLLALCGGVAVPSGSTVAFKKRDGSTTTITITYGAADGERTASVIA